MENSKEDTRRVISENVHNLKKGSGALKIPLRKTKMNMLSKLTSFNSRLISQNGIVLMVSTNLNQMCALLKPKVEG